MKRMLLSMALVLGLVQVGVTSSFALTLDFSSLPGAVINFAGNSTFSFQPNGTGFSFQVTNVAGGSDPDTLALVGTISGTYTIGPVVTVDPGPPLHQVASVSGSGVFTIRDENNVNLTGTISFSTIETEGNTGSINESGNVNVSNLSYGGLNTDLQAFVNGTPPQGVVVVSYQFAPARSLSRLVTTASRTSFSGSGTPVPEPMSLLLLGSGLAGIGIWRRWSQK